MENVAAYKQHFESWKSKNLSSEAIKEELKANVTDATLLENIIAAYVKYCHEIRLQNGFIAIGTGAALCIISCMLTVFNPFPEFRSFVMVGLTSIGALLIMLGLYWVFDR